MYDYDYGMGEVGNMVSTVLIVAVIMVIVIIALIVLQIIGQWKCFKKAGYNGWETLIAGHNQFVNCTFAGVNPILILVFMFGSVVTIIPIIGWLAYVGFLIYYQVVLGLNTSKVFGKGTGFGIALAIPISAPIAWFILGKDENAYIGPQKNNNVAQSNVQMNNQQMYQQQVNNVQPTIINKPEVTPVVAPVMPVPETAPVQPQINNVNPTFCTNCGNALIPNAKFCTKCGKQI